MQPLLTTAQAMEYCQVSDRALRRWESQGKITSTKTPGGHKRFRLEDLQAMFEKSGKIPRKYFVANVENPST